MGNLSLAEALSRELVLRLPGKQALELVRCPAGSFTMGSPSSELGREDCEKLHQVVLTQDFFIGRYLVTRDQYAAVTNYLWPRSWIAGWPAREDRRPAESISWDMAVRFCRTINRRFADQIPRGYKVALPTEAQWEYACRAGVDTALNNGQNLTTEQGQCNNLDEVGWYQCNSQHTVHPVGQKRPNDWGIFDMHGNLYELCADWYGSYKGNATDPTGPGTGKYRVLRGGCWRDYAWYCRSACRQLLTPSFVGSCLGFRVALVPSTD